METRRKIREMINNCIARFGEGGSWTCRVKSIYLKMVIFFFLKNNNKDEKLTNSGMKKSSGTEVKIRWPVGRMSPDVVDAIVQNCGCVRGIP